MPRGKLVTAGEAKRMQTTVNNLRAKGFPFSKAVAMAARTVHRSERTIRKAMEGAYQPPDTIQTEALVLRGFKTPTVGPQGVLLYPVLDDRQRIVHAERMTGSINVISWSNDSVNVRAMSDSARGSVFLQLAWK